GRVYQFDRREHAPNRRRQQRVMGAAEHKGIDACLNERVDISSDSTIGQFILQPAFFDQWNEQWTRAAGNADTGIDFVQRLLVSCAFDRRARANYSDV